MHYKAVLWLALFSQPAFSFVHISQLKPRLPVSPQNPTLTFVWNGDAPELTEKGEVLDGNFADSSDQDLMAALLTTAMNTWTNVPTAYIILILDQNNAAHIDEHDETFSIVVESQESEAVAAAALPSFITTDPDPSDTENNTHIIHDCDISVSSSSVSAKSLLRTLVHELGHCLGLGHPHSSYRSIMSYSTLDESASLALDDKAGVSFLYPEPGQSEDVQYLTTCGVVGGGAGGAGLWLAVPLLVIGWRRFSKVSR
ncbi:matrixin family metalloprotease [Oligoflexus tunisiensis]|uniref:matrixin family metalloprotease n=1 Tax=Oligoflexus tunisiensis TaxID=708132 RepID=UPI000AEBA4A8|nr:matrixin family metalloprotease [Oligoflexus tunisiensis]